MTSVTSIRHRGSVLIIAMVIIFAITALVLTLNRQAHTQAQASANDYASQQADAIERGAEQYAMGLLINNRDTLDQLPESAFSAVPVGNGYFWFVRPHYNDPTMPKYGLLDESCKLNLNAITATNADSLLAINGVTPEIAGAIVDWHDPDDTLSPSGAETSTYSGLAEPYVAKNAPFESVEEMLLLNTVTRQIMYGDPTQTSAAPGDYYLTHGISDYFTIWSTQSLNAANGDVRVDVTTTPAQQAKAKLSPVLTQYLGASKATTALNNAFPQRNQTTIRDVFQFANLAGLNSADFALIEDYINSGSGAPAPLNGAAAPTPTGRKGQININLASREVLMTLAAGNTSLQPADIDTLLAARSAAVGNNPNSMAWVLDVLHNKANGLGRYVCARGDQYSADIVTASGNGRGFRHVHVVIDVSTTTPKIVFRHDISDHGWPLDQQILTSLRAGQDLTAGVSTVSGGMN